MRKHGLMLLEEFRDDILQLRKTLWENFQPFFFLVTEIKIKCYQFAQLLGSISSVSQQQGYWHFRWAITCFRLLSLVSDHQMLMVHFFPPPTVTMTTKNALILFKYPVEIWYLSHQESLMNLADTLLWSNDCHIRNCDI